MNTKYKIREANIEDIYVLVKHHCMMCHEIDVLENNLPDNEKIKNLEKAYTQKLSDELNNSICKAWVVELNKIIVASGVISISSFYPNLNDTTYMAAFVHSMFTEKEHRKNGLAIQILERIKKYCKEKEITRLILSASKAGRPVYESIGFKPAESFMAMILK